MTDRLAKGEKLQRGESLTSKNGAYTLTLQDDGNLVLGSQGEAVWATGTNGQDAERLEVQTDGNCVLYTSEKPIWHTDTKGAKDVRLILQDDRNLVLYGFDGVAWASAHQYRRGAAAADDRRRSSPGGGSGRGGGTDTGCRSAGPTASSATPATASRSADVHGGVGRHAVGDLGALLRRRQQVPADRQRQWHQQP